MIGHAIVYTATNSTIYVVGRVVPSIFKCYLPMAQAYTSDMCHKSTIVSKLGLLTAFANCSWMLGPIIGGYLATMYGNRIPWLLGSIGQHINLLLLYSLLPDTSNAIEANDKKDDDIRYDTCNSGHVRNSNNNSNNNNSRFSARLRDRSRNRPSPNATSTVAVNTAVDTTVDTTVCSYLNKNSNNDKSNNVSSDGTDNGTDSSDSWFELIFMLHIKFVFSLGNCIYETLHGQSLTTAPPLGLGQSSSLLGNILGLIGVLNALTNAYLLHYIALNFAQPGQRSWLVVLAAAALSQGLAIFVWGMVTSATNAGNYASYLDSYHDISSSSSSEDGLSGAMLKLFQLRQVVSQITHSLWSLLPTSIVNITTSNLSCFVLVSAVIAITNTLFNNLANGKISELSCFWVHRSSLDEF